MLAYSRLYNYHMIASKVVLIAIYPRSDITKDVAPVQVDAKSGATAVSESFEPIATPASTIANDHWGRVGPVEDDVIRVMRCAGMALVRFVCRSLRLLSYRWLQVTQDL